MAGFRLPGLSRRAVLEGAAARAAGSTLPRVGAAAESEATSDNRLWYRQPAAVWTEALPVGNGRIGAMVFGGATAERLQLNEDTLWTGGPYNPVNPAAHDSLPEVRRLIFEGRYADAQALANAKLMGVPATQMAYQSFGDLFLDLPGLVGREVRDYRRALDLDHAVASVQFKIDGTAFLREVVASPVDQVIAVHIEADAPFDLGIRLGSAQPGVQSIASDGQILLTGRNAPRAGIAAALTFAARAVLRGEGSSRPVASQGALGLRGRSATILLAMATSYRSFDDVSGDPVAVTKAQLDRVAGKAFAQIRDDASAAHRELFARTTIDLGRTQAADQPTDRRIRTSQQSDDPALAALYFNYGRYLLIRSSRPGSQPANLQGIWNESNAPPWQSKYTVNINTEMNYWPAEVTALPECVEPLIAMVRGLAVTGAVTAREMYGAGGWVCRHNTDLWRATAPIDGAQWGLWPTGGAWLCTHLWDHYDYGRDVEYLRSVYPLMRGAAQFFLDTLQRDPTTGYLVTNPSVSPENVHPGGASVCAGPAMDEQILRDLFDQVARAAAILDTDGDFAAKVMAERAKLAPDQIGAEGQLQEWQQDWDADAPEPHHRHVSHLYALFPSHQIDPDRTPALARAAKRSLEMRGDESTGWATAWRANLWARLRDGDHAHRILDYLLGPQRTYPNMFDAHPPFQIDGNFGGTRAIAEMLMQSDGEEILLLPALPRAWPTGSITGLRARGGCSVDLRWRAGALEEVVLTGSVAGRHRVRLGDARVEVALQPGERVTLRGARLIS